MGEAPVIRWRISSIGYLPPRLGEAFLFSGSRERAGNPQATWFLPRRRFLLLPHPCLLPKQEASFLLLPAPIPAVLPSCQAPLQQLGPLEFSCKPPA